MPCRKVLVVDMFGRILESNLLLNAMSECYVSVFKNKQWGLCWIFCLFLDFFSLEFLQVHWTYETFESSMGEKPIKTLRKVRVRTEPCFVQRGSFGT